MGMQPIQPQHWEKSTTANPKIEPRNQTQTHTHTRQNYFLSPLLLSQQRITTVTAKNHHSFLKPKAPFAPVSFPISSPGNPSIENHNPCIFSINQTLQTHTQQTQTHFSQKSGLLCFFHRNKTICLVSVKKHSKPMLCFSTRCDFPSLLLICVSCVLCISCALLA